MRLKFTIYFIIFIFFIMFKPVVTATVIHQNPITLSDYNLIFTNVEINGHKTLALIDSGSFRSIEVSSTLIKKLGIETKESNLVAKRYKNKQYRIKSAKVNLFRIGSFELHDAAVQIATNDIESIASQVKTKFDVILGFGFISKYHFLIDYKKKNIEWSTSPFEKGKSTLNLKYQEVNRVPVVEAKLNNKTVKMLLDTGAPMCNLDLLMSNGAIKGDKVKRNITLEKNDFKVIFRIKDLTAIKKSLDCYAVVGNNFLMNYSIYFNPANKTVEFFKH